MEFPDTWLTHGNPWEVQRLDITYPVTFYGNEKVIAVAYDTPIPGYDTLNTNSLRLWSAMPDQDIDLGKFNEGDYSKALAARQRALEITQVGVTSTCFWGLGFRVWGSLPHVLLRIIIPLGVTSMHRFAAEPALSTPQLFYSRRW